jgi:hypothetical protein
VKAYWVGYWISFVILFVGCWIYCIKSYGFLIGVGIGWLPSAIAAGLFSLGWPLLLLGAVCLVTFLLST